jgi:hypothetical protein
MQSASQNGRFVVGNTNFDNLQKWCEEIFCFRNSENETIYET